jgi:hypothetical protein
VRVSTSPCPRCGRGVAARVEPLAVAGEWGCAHVVLWLGDGAWVHLSGTASQLAAELRRLAEEIDPRPEAR